MRSVAQHYAEHLAPIYVWMAGGADAALAAGDSELDDLHLPNHRGDCVLDLGAGFGVHAIPMARRGARVTAVDSSAELVNVLNELGAGLDILTVNTDLAAFLRADRGVYDAILCMGDTLTHLASHEEVDEILGLAAGQLAPGGRLVLTFRDYTTALEEENRFIPVRSDDERIFTCFLDFGETAVRVHDIVHERGHASSGTWRTRVSAYSKLRIAPQALVQRLRRLDLDARAEPGVRGMVRVVAARTE